MNEIEAGPAGLSIYRIAFYCMATAWLLMLPTFGANASHFGWGFFPMLASIFVIPVAALVLLGDGILAVDDALRQSEAGKKRFLKPALSLVLGTIYAVLFVLMVSNLH